MIHLTKLPSATWLSTEESDKPETATRRLSCFTQDILGLILLKDIWSCSFENCPKTHENQLKYLIHD
jgi:hypothetical protein